MNVDSQKAHQAGHRSRLKQRFSRDSRALADYEILELLLGYVLLRRDTKGLAKDILQRCGSLRGFLESRPEELEYIPRFGPGTALFRNLLREFFARCAEDPVRQRQVLATPQEVAYMARKRLAGLPHEECWIALLDTQNRLLAWECIQRGTLASVSVQPRDILESALRHKATGIILVHNHPGGNALPSAADLSLTDGLHRLAQLMQIRLVDHVIVTEEDCYSILTKCLI